MLVISGTIKPGVIVTTPAVSAWNSFPRRRSPAAAPNRGGFILKRGRMYPAKTETPVPKAGVFSAARRSPDLHFAEFFG
jgi:hypothetical protein